MLDDLAWARSFLVPWVARRLTGRSSGDGLEGKRRVPKQYQPTPS